MNLGGFSGNCDFFLSIKRWASRAGATRGGCTFLSQESTKRQKTGLRARHCGSRFGLIEGRARTARHVQALADLTYGQ